MMRTGVDPYGRAIDNGLMPWQSYAAAFADDELGAIFNAIRSLAPVTAPAQVGITPPAATAPAGERLFHTYCAVCHNLGTEQ